MKWSNQMKTIITQLADKHGLDLTAEEAHLRLVQPDSGLMPLVIEKIGRHVISIAHYYKQYGDLIADPDVEIFIQESGDETYWIPIAIQHAPPFAHYVVTAKLNAERSAITHISPRHQRDLTTFVNQWARNIKNQGWLEHGQIE